MYVYVCIYIYIYAYVSRRQWQSERPTGAKSSGPGPRAVAVGKTDRGQPTSPFRPVGSGSRKDRPVGKDYSAPLRAPVGLLAVEKTDRGQEQRRAARYAALQCDILDHTMLYHIMM